MDGDWRVKKLHLNDDPYLKRTTKLLVLKLKIIAKISALSRPELNYIKYK